MSAADDHVRRRKDFRMYRDAIHPRRAHQAASCAVLQTLWRKSRRTAVDVWGELGDVVTTYGLTESDLKAAFRKHVVTRQRGLCCYCRSPLLGIAHAKPIEHVLPRVRYPQFSLDFWNLAVACHRCNHFKDRQDWGAFAHRRRVYPAAAECRGFYHPSYHDFNDHVRFVRTQTNQGCVTVFRGLTPQGRHLCVQLLHRVSEVEMQIWSDPELMANLTTIAEFATGALDGDENPVGGFRAALENSLT